MDLYLYRRGSRKGAHPAAALDRSGNRLFDKALPNNEEKLRGIITGLKTYGPMLLMVDHPRRLGRCRLR